MLDSQESQRGRAQRGWLAAPPPVPVVGQRRVVRRRCRCHHPVSDDRCPGPAPAGFVAERDVDWDKVQHLIFSDAPPEARAAIRAGELRWALSGFDREGWGSVSVFRADNGEEVAGARCHWSAIVKRDVTEPS